MKAAIPSEIIRCLRYDGHTNESGARYCRSISLQARYNAFATPGDADAYQEAAERLEAEVKAEMLALENVERLEEENRHLAERVLELERTIVELTNERERNKNTANPS